MSAETDPIILACEAEWDNWKSDCSGFVKAVAARLGINLSGNANQLIDSFGHSADWQNLEHDAKAAINRALLGQFVIGGLGGQSHGHVVVVVNLPSLQYPIAYWGRFGAVGRKRTPINWSFQAPALSKVEFFARKI
jgi:hypothetical protein